MAEQSGGRFAGQGLALLQVGTLTAMTLLYFGAAVFEPLVFAIFIIALTAPFMHRLQPIIGKGLALIVTLLLTIAVLVSFFSIVFWGVSQVAGWVMANLGRFDAVYNAANDWLAARDMPLEILLPDAAPKAVIAFTGGPSFKLDLGKMKALTSTATNGTKASLRERDDVFFMIKLKLK